MAAEIPPELADVLTGGALGHVSAIRPDGSVAQYLMWVDFDGSHVLTSSPVGSRKGQHFRRDPRVAVSVVDRNDDWRYLVIRGRVVDIRPDENLAFIDRMSQRYTGAPYRFRNDSREVFVIEPEHVRASTGRRPPPKPEE